MFLRTSKSSQYLSTRIKFNYRKKSTYKSDSVDVAKSLYNYSKNLETKLNNLEYLKIDTELQKYEINSIKNNIQLFNDKVKNLKMALNVQEDKITSLENYLTIQKNNSLQKIIPLRYKK